MPKPNDFWSRRRRAVAAEEDEQARRDDEADRQTAEAELEAVDDETLLQMLGLPDPETLTPADAARFMAREVPGRLRKRALRALFQGYPGLAVPDGLDDYNEDYTKMPLGPRPGRTVWNAVQRVAKELSDTDEPALTAVEEADVDEQAEVQSTQTVEADDSGEPLAEAPPMRPRRMTFSFEETET